MKTSDIRRQNLVLILDNFDSQEELGLYADVSAGYIRQVKGAHRNMGDDVARRLEKALKLDEGWMDVTHDKNSELKSKVQTLAEEPLTPYYTESKLRKIIIERVNHMSFNKLKYYYNMMRMNEALTDPEQDESKPEVGSAH